MRKIIFLIAILSAISYSEKCSTIEKLANLKKENKNEKIELEELTAKKVEKIDYIFKEVLKTSHQLVPKYVNNIVITGVDEKYFDKAKESINILIRANSIYPDLTVYLDTRQEKLEDIKKIVENLNVKNIRYYNNEKNLFSDIIDLNKGKTDLLYRRVALLTKATKMRVEYSRLINALDENKNDIVIDNYSYLDGISRGDLEKISIDEIYNSYSLIDCKK